GKDDGVLWDFFVTEGMKAGKWSKIPVPSNWELHGFGKYNYGFDKEEKKGKEKGLYKYTFTVDKAWKGRVINLVFEGVMTDAEVKVNGKSAGEIHQGSFYVFKYDVSKLLNYNKDNLLEVTVAKHSENKSVNAAEREALLGFWGYLPPCLSGSVTTKPYSSRINRCKSRWSVPNHCGKKWGCRRNSSAA